LKSDAQLRVLKCGVRFTPANHFSDRGLAAKEMTESLCRSYAIAVLARQWHHTESTVPQFLKPRFNPFLSNTWKQPNLVMERVAIQELRRNLPQILLSYMSRPMGNHNLTAAEVTAYMELINDDEFVFIKADKDRIFVKMHKTAYIDLCLQDHLSNREVYQYIGEVKSAPVSTFISQQIARVKKLAGLIPMHFPFELRAALIRALTPGNYRTPAFRILIKTHKNPMTTRPIAGAVSWISSKASKWLSSFLLPHVKAIPTRIGRVEDLIKKIEEFNESTTKLTAGPSAKVEEFHSNCKVLVGGADVTAMYPSIPTDEGIAALHWFLQNRGIEEDTITFVVQLAHWILTSMCVRLGPWIFNQIRGTAMGTNFAPEYANIVMFQAESRAFNRIPPGFPSRKGTICEPLFKPFSPLTFLSNPDSEYKMPTPYYGRYIDDIIVIIVVPRSITNYSEMERTLKATTHSSSLDLSAITFGTSIDFLDLHIEVDEYAHITYEIFYKPSNTHLHLPPFSQHAPGVRKAWPIAEFKRILARCSNLEMAQPHILNFMRTLADRGFPQDLILRSFKLAMNPRPRISYKPTLIPMRFNRMTEGMSIPNIVSLALVSEPFLRSMVNQSKLSPAWTQAPNLEERLKPRQSNLQHFIQRRLGFPALSSPYQWNEAKVSFQSYEAFQAQEAHRRLPAHQAK
jgi:hypothetical protein